MASWQSRVLCFLFRITVKRAGRKGVDIARTRAKMGTPRPRALKVPSGWSVSPVTAEGLTFEKIERPGLRDDLAVLYLHGGGYFFGSPQTHRRLSLSFADNARAPVYTLDYRLAPENRYPAAFEDAVAAYRWLARTQPNRRIVLAGDSAGGGLAVATAVAVRDLGLPRPAAVVCFSPWTDLAATGASIETNSGSDAMFSGDGIRATALIYLGDHDARDPGASPHYAEMTGLPPMQIFVSRDEVLRDDGVRLAEKAKARGVDCELHVVAGMPHVWPLFAPFLPEGRESLAQVGAFINRVAAERYRCQN